MDFDSDKSDKSDFDDLIDCQYLVLK